MLLMILIAKREFKIEKVIKKKDDEICVKWKEYNDSFNSWIDKKDSINERVYFLKSKS